jgi:hypothetical protein
MDQIPKSKQNRFSHLDIVNWYYVENKMVKNLPSMVIPSKEGIQAFSFLFWIPAFAGMTPNRRVVNSIFMVCG